MNETLTGLTAPAFIRGRLITEELVGFGGRGGAAMFRVPDPHRLLGALPLSDPSLLREVQDMPFDEIVAYLAALGEALVLVRNPHLQEALELSAQFSDMTPPLVRSSFEQLPALFTPAAVRELADATIGIPYLQGWVPRVMADGRTASIRAFGARTVHIIAGNSPLIAALSIIRNAVARSDAIIKTPSNDPLTALAIARTMGELDAAHPITRHLSVAYWKGGDDRVRATAASTLRRREDHRLGRARLGHPCAALRPAGPGADLARSQAQRNDHRAPRPSPLTRRSPTWRCGRPPISVRSTSSGASTLAWSMWRAAPTPTDSSAPTGWVSAIYAELQRLPQHLSTRAKWSDPELIADIDALRSSPEWYRVYGGRDGEGAVIVSQLDEPVEFSRRLSGRVANIVPIDDPADAIRGINAYTQTVGIYPETLKLYLREQLPLHGAQRLVSLGYAAHPNVSLPQDGMEPMRRMVKWIVEERCEPDAVQPLWASASSDGEEWA